MFQSHLPIMHYIDSECFCKGNGMVLCTVHNKVYMPALERWLPADPVYVRGLSIVIAVTEGTCDACLKTAKMCLVMQFPALFVHESLTPSV